MLSDALVTACKLVRSVQTKALPSECHDSRQDPAGALYASYPAGASRSSYARPRPPATCRCAADSPRAANPSKRSIPPRTADPARAADLPRGRSQASGQTPAARWNLTKGGKYGRMGNNRDFLIILSRSSRDETLDGNYCCIG